MNYKDSYLGQVMPDIDLKRHIEVIPAMKIKRIFQIEREDILFGYTEKMRRTQSGNYKYSGCA